MTVLHYVRAIRHRWYLIVLFAIAGVAAAGIVSFEQKPVYSASVQLFVSTSGAGTDISQLNQGGTFTQQRVKSYVDIVNSPEVTEAVIGQLQLSYTLQQLSKNIQASTRLDTVLLDIEVTDTSPSRARDIANAVAGKFPQFVDKIETPANKTVSPVKVSITRPASLPTA